MRIVTICALMITAISVSEVASGQAEFTVAQRITLNDRPNRWRVIDLNADGRDDLVSEGWSGTSEALLCRGAGVFDQTSRALAPFAGGEFGFGDVDGDGDPDLVASSYNRFTTYWNDGSGGFSPGRGSVGLYLTYLPLQLADFDDDGHLDIAALGGPSVNSLDLFFGDGSGAFPARLSIPLGGSPSSFAPANLDGTAPLELALSLADRTVASIRRSAGRSFVVVEGPRLTYESRIEQVADTNRDGLDDLLLIGVRHDMPLVRSAVTLLQADGQGSFLQERILHAGSIPVYAARGGVFGFSNALDLLITTQREEIFCRGALLPGGPACTELRLPRTAGITAALDFDADGDLDLVRNEGTGTSLVTWRNQARHELHLPFDESSGAVIYDAARGSANAPRFTVLGATRWQGDPGPGREAFRGNDAGSGMLRRGSGAHLESFRGSGMVDQAVGSCTIAWWQRMGAEFPPQCILWEAADIICGTGEAAYPDRLVFQSRVPLGAPLRISATSVLVPHRWRHFALTAEHQSGVAQLYVDGVAEPTSMSMPPVTLRSFSHLGIGSDIGGRVISGDYFDFDEFRVYPRILSAAEILSLQRGKGITVAPMGDGCFERRAEEGLHISAVNAGGDVIEVALDTSGLVGGVAFLAFGVSSAHLEATPLPFDFGYGCVLRTSLDALVPMPIGSVSTLVVRLPPSPGALLGHMHVQGLILAAGVQTTRAFDLKLRY